MIEFFTGHYSLYAIIYSIAYALIFFIYGLVIFNIKKYKLVIGVIATIMLIVMLIMLNEFNTFIQIKHESLFRLKQY